MKKFAKIFISALCAALIAVPLLCAACNNTENTDDNTDKTDNGGDFEPVDYVSQLKFDKNSNTKKVQVVVRNKGYIDGDTTHFDPVVQTSDFDKTQGYIKARYLAINTPESTGKIEEWGKAASKFTRSKLESAESIWVESDDDKWNVDSTGGRYLLWIWYKPQGVSEYRNLNVEILQEGLAIGSNAGGNRYGSYASGALAQAQKQKLYVFSGEKDPDFFYGDAIPLTMKELRCHAEDYAGTKVAVDGVVVGVYNSSVYVEDYDENTETYFGIQVYYGASPLGDVIEILSVGNCVKVVGTVSYYENGDDYQIAGVTYNPFKPDDPNNCQLISKGNSAAYTEIDAKKLNTDFYVNFEVENDEGETETETVQIKYGEAIRRTSVSLNNLKVVDIYTTKTGDSTGAMSITCETADGTSIVIRTAVLKADGKIVTAEAYEGKTISVKGFIDKYEGKYQVFCYRTSQITVVE